jgi:hypothetical protein
MMVFCYSNPDPVRIQGSFGFPEGVSRLARDSVKAVIQITEPDRARA